MPTPEDDELRGTKVCTQHTARMVPPAAAQRKRPREEDAAGPAAVGTDGDAEIDESFRRLDGDLRRCVDGDNAPWRPFNLVLLPMALARMTPRSPPVGEA